MAQHDAPVQAAPPAAPAAPGAGRDRFLLAIVAGTLVLVVVSVASVLMLGRSRPSPADPNGPAGVVYGYIEAVRAGDTARARGYLASQARADFDDRNRQSPIRPTPDDQVRIVVETTAATDTSAEVKVTISRFYARSDPFSSGTSHHDVTARLVKEDGAWKISVPPLAYELY